MMAEAIPAASVQSLRLGQFRSYARAEIETGGASVALIGPNGAGKTNALEAVSLLVPGRGLRRADPSAFALVAGDPPLSGGWRLRAELDLADRLIEVVTGAAPGETRRTVEIDGKSASQTALGTHLRIVWLTPAMDRLWSDGAGDRRRFVDRIALGFEPGHATVSLAYEKAMRERNRLLKDGIDNPSWLAALEAQMARLGAALARARADAIFRVSAAQNTAETLFPRAELRILGDMESRFADALNAREDLDHLEGQEAAGLAVALEASRPRDAVAGRALVGPHRSDLEAIYAAKAMPARLCSTGEQKALLISLCLANARALGTHTGTMPVLLFDEIAAHLDAARRHALYGEIAALGAQAWMTGTETHLFDGLEGAMHLTVSETNGQSALATA